MRELSVFVSSTSQDLQDHRAVARHVILDMSWRPKMMEHFGTQTEPTVDACRGILKECDVMLMIVGFRRGWVPRPDQGGNGIDSVTALELQYARENKIPVLLLMASDTWPGNLWEDDGDARKWVKEFRQNVNLPAVFFDYEALTTKEDARLPGFRSKIREALLDHQARLLRSQSAEFTDGAKLAGDYFTTARDGLLSGNDVPFLGTGVYGDGPLSSAELTRALVGKSAPDKLLSLATAAEYREQFLGSRPVFLKALREVLEVQEEAAEEPPIYDLLQHLEKLPLIVSATYDQVLEKRFRAKGIAFTTVAHILRSADGEHNGKILVLREGAEPEITAADKVDVRADTRIIYKPLGSPFLHDKLDPDLEIDTVVITETDHLTFLGRLENQATQIPPAVTRLFRRRPLLFVGYGLDIWQYRLVMQVFQSVGSRGKSSTMAVRVPDAALEEVAWKRLGADLIRMDLAEFVRLMAVEAVQ